MIGGLDLFFYRLNLGEISGLELVKSCGHLSSLVEQEFQNGDCV